MVGGCSYILLNKPYGVLSQFGDKNGRPTLRDFGPFPVTVYPVGRLDMDSEGLLFLTDDNAIKHALTDPNNEQSKTYLVQVEKIPPEEELDRLRRGVLIRGFRTKPANVERLLSAPSVYSRTVPIRHRKNIPTSWISITIREGRNRQVRRMTAAVGFPTLRLIRTALGPLTIDGLAPGQSRHLTLPERETLQSLLRPARHCNRSA